MSATIRSIISSLHQSDKEIQEELKGYKKFWKSYDINEMNSEANAKMQACFNVAGKEIIEYKALLQCFIYGKYFHDDKFDLFLATALIESNPMGYAVAKSELQGCIYLLSKFLRNFDRTYIKPILKGNSNRIQNFKKMVTIQ